MIHMRRNFLAGCLLAAFGCVACGGSAPANSAANSSASGQQAANVSVGPVPAQTHDIGKLDAEIARLEADAVRHPDDSALRSVVADAYARRAAVHYEAHRLQEALRDYQSALSFDPSNEEAQLRVTQINQELEPEVKTDDGKPVTVTAKPGMGDNNGNSNR